VLGDDFTRDESATRKAQRAAAAHFAEAEDSFVNWRKKAGRCPFAAA